MTPSISHIIVATDFSDISKEAIAYASWLQETTNATLTVVHVFDPTMYNVPAPYMFMPGFDQWYNENVQTIRDKGQKALTELQESLGEHVGTFFVEGKPGTEIVNVAKEQNADLIVLGTHGYTGWSRLALGSVAEHVVRHAHCPVLTTKGSTTDA